MNLDVDYKVVSLFKDLVILVEQNSGVDFPNVSSGIERIAYFGDLLYSLCKIEREYDKKLDVRDFWYYSLLEMYAHMQRYGITHAMLNDNIDGFDMPKEVESAMKLFDLVSRVDDNDVGLSWKRRLMNALISHYELIVRMVGEKMGRSFDSMIFSSSTLEMIRYYGLMAMSCRLLRKRVYILKVDARCDDMRELYRKMEREIVVEMGDRFDSKKWNIRE